MCSFYKTAQCSTLGNDITNIIWHLLCARYFKFFAYANAFDTYNNLMDVDIVIPFHR